MLKRICIGMILGIATSAAALPWGIQNLEIGAAALWWQPTHDGVQVATLQDPPAQPSFPLFLQPKHNWGYTIWGRGSVCVPCVYLGGRYTSFNTERSLAFDSPGSPSLLPVFAPILVNFQDATARITSKYRMGEMEAGVNTTFCRWFTLEGFAGARYFNITETEQYLYTGGPAGAVAPAFQNYSLRGWGPRFGLSLEWEPLKDCFDCFGISFLSSFGVTATVGNRRLDVGSTADVGAFPQGSLAFPKRRAIGMAFDYRLELNAWVEVFCVEIAARVGWALDYYLNARARLDTTNTLGIAPRSTSAMGYGGPFFGMSLRY